jgi:hypothetical protein
MQGGCAGLVSGETDGSLEFASNPMKGGCIVGKDARAYLNVVPNMPPRVPNEAPWWGNHPDRNGVWDWREVICEEAINSPLGVTGPDGPSPAAAAAAASSAASGNAQQAALNAYRAAHPCHVCAYNDGNSCITCQGDPIPCGKCTDPSDPVFGK